MSYQMALIQPTIKGEVLEVTAPNMPKFTVSLLQDRSSSY